MYVIPLEVESGTHIGLCLLKNLKNVKGLRKKILSGELNCCAIKPGLIIDPMQVIVAARKAVISKETSKLITKSLNSELLYNLSISKNITQSLSTFGIGEKDENALIVVFEEKGSNLFQAVKLELEGEECSLKDLSKFCDIELLKKTYKISETELQVSTLADSAISRIATKEFGAY